MPRFSGKQADTGVPVTIDKDRYVEGDVSAALEGGVVLGEKPGNVAFPVQIDAAGNLKVIVSGGTAGHEYQDGAVNTSAYGRLILGDDGANLQCIKVDAAGHLQIDVIDGKYDGVQYQDGAAVASPFGTVVLGHDGSNVFPVTIDAAGHLQVDVVASALPSGAATQTTLASLLTELQGKADLGETQPVSVSSQPADTFAAEAAALGKGVLIQGDDGVDRHNIAVDASGNVQVDVVGALPSGSAAIGKLAANSGVDIGDVDVLSLPALVAGSAKIGTVEVGKCSITQAQIVVNINTATTTVLKAAVAGHTYTIMSIVLTVAAENNLTWKSAATAISGPMDFGASGEPHGMTANLWPCGLKCTVGEALQLTTTTTGQVSGFITILDES